MTDTRIRHLLKETGAELNEEAVMEPFREWVLPDRHLTLIRERIERWREVARRRTHRKQTK